MERELWGSVFIYWVLLSRPLWLVSTNMEGARKMGYALMARVFNDCSYERIGTMELYSNNISGPIPNDLGNLTNLVSLDLYLNRFSGPIPQSLGKLSKLRFFFNNNLDLCGPVIGHPCPGSPPFSPPPPFVPPSPISAPEGNSAIGAIAGVVVGVALLFVAPAIVFAWWRQRKPQEFFFDVPDELSHPIQLNTGFTRTREENDIHGSFLFVIWVRFVRCWCNKIQLASRTKKHPNKIFGRCDEYNLNQGCTSSLEVNPYLSQVEELKQKLIAAEEKLASPEDRICVYDEQIQELKKMLAKKEAHCRGYAIGVEELQKKIAKQYMKTTIPRKRGKVLRNIVLDEELVDKLVEKLLFHGYTRRKNCSRPEEMQLLILFSNDMSLLETLLGSYTKYVCGSITGVSGVKGEP
ncbi:hypothetical protein JHK82_024917 [Glycine max]|nr:hypothetical protein JHK82_024917 [Glycine max]